MKITQLSINHSIMIIISTYSRALYISIILFLSITILAQGVNEHMAMAKVCYSKHEYDKAVKYIDYVIKSKPNEGEAYLFKGKCKFELDMYNEALDNFNVAVNLLPQESENHYYKGMCEWKMKRYNAAIKSLDEALMFSPDNMLAYHYLGSIYYELQMFSVSKENFDKAVDFSPDLSQNMFSKQRLMEEYGEHYKFSIRNCNKDIKKNPTDSKYMFYRSLFKAMSGDNWGAYIDINKCIELSPNSSMYYFYRGFVNSNIKKFKESLEDLYKYLKKNPQDATAKVMIENIVEMTHIKIAFDDDEVDSQVFLATEKMPEFVGGMKEMYKFISAHIKYPSQAMEDGVEGRVIVSFIIDSKGDIRNIQIEKAIGGGCELEAMRVINLMPSWKPGKQNGKNVNVKYVMPIAFRLNPQ